MAEKSTPKQEEGDGETHRNYNPPDEPHNEEDDLNEKIDALVGEIKNTISPVFLQLGKVFVHAGLAITLLGSDWKDEQ